ncbi:MAG: hypothetical protein WBR15_10910 [Gammaproteobacteria bacterium]
MQTTCHFCLEEVADFNAHKEVCPERRRRLSENSQRLTPQQQLEQQQKEMERATKWNRLYTNAMLFYAKKDATIEGAFDDAVKFEAAAQLRKKQFDAEGAA